MGLSLARGEFKKEPHVRHKSAAINGAAKILTKQQTLARRQIVNDTRRLTKYVKKGHVQRAHKQPEVACVASFEP